jgi:hypothetical protein
MGIRFIGAIIRRSAQTFTTEDAEGHGGVWVSILWARRENSSLLVEKAPEMGGPRLDKVPLAALRGTAEAAVATWFVVLVVVVVGFRGTGY